VSEGFPFGDFDPSQLLRFLAGGASGAGQVTAEVARWVALDGGRDEAVAGEASREWSDLVRAAQLHVAAATPLAADLQVPVRAVGRGAWVDLAVPGLEPVLSELAATLQQSDGDDAAIADDEGIGEEGVGDDPAAPFAGFLTVLAPLLLGVQSGFMVGYLARYLHAHHDLALPMANDPGIIVIQSNLDEFRREWDLPADELHFYVAIHEVVRAAVRSVPWVSPRLVDLAQGYARSLTVDPSAIEDQLAGFDPSHPESLQDALGDPGVLLGAFDSPGRRHALARLQQFTMVLEGYADDVLARVGQPLLPALGRIREARQRHRVERGDAQRFVERLLGMEMEREHYERGAAFAAGVVERAGPDALNRLWEREEMLPTSAELEAPGLWLARIELMDQ